MNELASIASLIVSRKSSQHSSRLRELELLLIKFYEIFKPSKCATCDQIAEYYLDQLPLLSQRLLEAYGSDLCFVLNDSHKRTRGWSTVELQILLVRYYSMINPSNVKIAKDLATNFTGSQTAFSDLNKLLKDKYGTDLRETLSISGQKASTVGSLKIWVGSFKLEKKLPTVEAIAKVLYNNASNSADGADVIALHLTDLAVTEENKFQLQGLLRKVVRDPEDYVFNEEDRGLVLPNFPAQMTHVSEESQIFVLLSVAVHKRNLQDYDGDGTLDHHDCFPLPVYLTCKAPSKDDAAACCILAQDVVITRGGTVMDLALLAAVLDADNVAREKQLCDAQRLLKARQGQRPFCALIWGDLGSRLVAYEELREHATEKNGEWTLKASGVDLLVQKIQEPEGRKELLGKDSLVYSGKDISGNKFETPKCSDLMRKLFKTHVDAVNNQHLPVPLPSFRRSPLDRMATELFGFTASFPEVVCLESMLSSTSSGHFLEAVKGSRAEYFGWKVKGKHGAEKEVAQQRIIKEEPASDGSKQLYLQLGWLDGVGVYKGGTNARLKWWETEDQVLAFDHLPIRSVVEVECGDGPPLRVWMCAVKLDYRRPSDEALNALLYGSKDASAENADVVALSFTDLLVTEENVRSLRQMLRKAMRCSDDYLFNEDDDGLVLRNIPAQLVRAAEVGERFVSLSVAVHKRNVGDYDGDGKLDHHDCFPVPVYLTCKSGRKNEVTACGKAILAQDVIITCRGTVMDLIMLSANLDTDDIAKLGQLKELKRLLKSRQGQRPFAALIWGDLNNRLVAFEDLRKHVVQKKGKWLLTDSGVNLLVSMIDTPEGRLNLLSKDSLVYSGKDLAGAQFNTPKCNILLQDLFSLHTDSVKNDGLPVPMPSYKRSPLDLLVSSSLGCSVHFRDIVCRHDRDTIQLGLKKEVVHKVKDCRWAYFDWVVDGKSNGLDEVRKSAENKPFAHEDRQSEETRNADHQIMRAAGSNNLFLHVGWPDGVGVYRNGTASGRIVAWDTEQEVQAFDHLPIRATFSVDVPSKVQTQPNPPASASSDAPCVISTFSTGQEKDHSETRSIDIPRNQPDFPLAPESVDLPCLTSVRRGNGSVVARF